MTYRNWEVNKNQTKKPASKSNSLDIFLFFNQWLCKSSALYRSIHIDWKNKKVRSICVIIFKVKSPNRQRGVFETSLFSVATIILIYVHRASLLLYSSSFFVAFSVVVNCTDCRSYFECVPTSQVHNFPLIYSLLDRVNFCSFLFSQIRTTSQRGWWSNDIFFLFL